MPRTANPAAPKPDEIDKKIATTLKSLGIESTPSLHKTIRAAALQAALNAINTESVPKFFIEEKERELEAVRAKFLAKP